MKLPWKHIIRVYVYRYVLYTYLWRVSQNTFQLNITVKWEKKKKTNPWTKMPWPQSLPHPRTCISFPAQLACKDGKQNLIFHGAQSTNHVQIQYKEMLYLILYRLITQNCEKLQKAMTRFSQMTCKFLQDTLKPLMKWKI